MDQIIGRDLTSYLICLVLKYMTGVLTHELEIILEIFGGSLELPMWLTNGFLVTFFGKVVGSCAHTRESHTATVHSAPYMVNSRVVVGAIYAYMCTYSYHTWCTIHGELTCGGGGNIRIHVYLQLPYTVYHTR